MNRLVKIRNMAGAVACYFLAASQYGRGQRHSIARWQMPDELHRR